MAEKIQTKSGSSIADTYDVVGSIAGVQELDQDSVKVVHEMGATIASERMGVSVLRVDTGVILQSVVFGASIFGVQLPPTVFKLVNLIVFADVAGRLTNVAVVARDPNAAVIQEVPIWTWDGGATNTVRMSDEGAATAEVEVLIPTAGISAVPLFMSGRAQPNEFSELIVRGTTSAFGGGDVTIAMLAVFAHPDHALIGGSVGLPIPSW